MRWKFVTWLTVKATAMSDWLLRNRNWRYTADDYRRMPENSMGKKLICYMDQHRIPFKPNLVRHDLKHILLGYEMRMPDELRIHAFLFGNRCYNAMGIIYLAICMLFVPEVTPCLWQDYKRGRKAIPLKKIDLSNFVEQDVDWCRQTWNISPPNPVGSQLLNTCHPHLN